jgi:hypothetical protein
MAARIRRSVSDVPARTGAEAAGPDTRGTLARAALTVSLLIITSVLLLGHAGGQPPRDAASETAGAPTAPTFSRQPARSDPAPAGGASPGAARPSTSPGGLTIVSSTVKSWPGPGVTRAQVLVKLRNDAPTALRFVPSGSRYRILDSKRREVASGVFTYAVPDRVAPGGYTYLLETVSALLVEPGEVGSVEVTPLTRVTEQADSVLTVAEVSWRRGAGGGLEATGIVTNNTSVTVGTGFVSVLFFDGHDALIGAVYDLTDIQNLAPGRSTRFATAYPGTAPLTPGSVARAEGIAFALQD